MAYTKFQLIKIAGDAKEAEAKAKAELEKIKAELDKLKEAYEQAGGDSTKNAETEDKLKSKLKANK